MAEPTATTDDNNNPPPLPAKRPLDDLLISPEKEEEDEENNDPKKPKFQTLDSASIDDNGVNYPVGEQTLNPDDVAVDPKLEKQEVKEDEAEEEVEGEKNGKAAVVIDRKGKGILVESDTEDDDDGDDERSDDDDDDDDDDSDDDGGDDDDGNLSDGDGELSDDPLAEVDLENILPSRTRRRVVNPGAYDASFLAGVDDSDSDDSDA